MTKQLALFTEAISKTAKSNVQVTMIDDQVRIESNNGMDLLSATALLMKATKATFIDGINQPNEDGNVWMAFKVPA